VNRHNIIDIQTRMPRRAHYSLYLYNVITVITVINWRYINHHLVSHKYEQYLSFAYKLGKISKYKIPSSHSVAGYLNQHAYKSCIKAHKIHRNKRKK